MKYHTRRFVDRVRLFRNDPCKCGSGKKYKYCCLSRRARKPRVQTHRAREQ